jgi:hypothetical protein
MLSYGVRACCFESHYTQLSAASPATASAVFRCNRTKIPSFSCSLRLTSSEKQTPELKH